MCSALGRGIKSNIQYVHITYYIVLQKTNLKKLKIYSMLPQVVEYLTEVWGEFIIDRTIPEASIH